jgi:hypothetical protein
MRTDNSNYVDLQNKIRVGIWDEHTRTQILDRYGKDFPDTDDDDLDDYTPALVCYNKTRSRLEDMKLLAYSLSCEKFEDLPIIVTAKINAKKKNKPLNDDERAYINALPDNLTAKAPSALALYKGAVMLINNNINTDCSLAQGSRCRVVGWSFAPDVKFQEGVYHGSRVRFPMAAVSALGRAQPECVYVQTMSKMRAIPMGQPAGLPPNTVCLPMFSLSTKVKLTGIPLNDRGSVSVNIRQLPLRPANAITTYACIGCEFNRYFICETNKREFYTQISRGRNGLDSVVLATELKRDFKPQPHPAVALE